MRSFRVRGAIILKGSAAPVFGWAVWVVGRMGSNVRRVFRPNLRVSASYIGSAACFWVLAAHGLYNENIFLRGIPGRSTIVLCSHTRSLHHRFICMSSTPDQKLECMHAIFMTVQGRYLPCAHGKNSAFLPLPSSPFFPTLTFPRDGQHVTKYHATCMKLQGKLVDDHDSAWNHVPIVVRAYYLPHHPYPAQPPILLSENML